MALQKNIRGMQDIRTHNGMDNQVYQPYKAYMKISCLEMEKARLGKEKEKAQEDCRIPGSTRRNSKAKRFDYCR